MLLFKLKTNRLLQTILVQLESGWQLGVATQVPCQHGSSTSIQPPQLHHGLRLVLFFQLEISTTSTLTFFKQLQEVDQTVYPPLETLQITLNRQL